MEKLFSGISIFEHQIFRRDRPLDWHNRRYSFATDKQMETADVELSGTKAANTSVSFDEFDGNWAGGVRDRMMAESDVVASIPTFPHTLLINFNGAQIACSMSRPERCRSDSYTASPQELLVAV